MRIAVCEFHQETNSINPNPSVLEDYAVFGIWEGMEMLEKGHGSSALGGMLDVLEREGAEVIPTKRMWANAAGPVEQKIVEDYLEKVICMLRAAGPLDGVCVSLHGATQSTGSDDVCGDILEAVRSVAGTSAVIAASLDLHGNVTDKMLENADYICGYHTYPHVDFYETGSRAANLCLRKIKDRNNCPVMLQSSIPMILPASAYNTLEGPFAELMQYGQTLVDAGELLDFSVFQMQPWLDVSVGGSSVITIAEEPKIKWITELAERLVGIRHKLRADLKKVEDIIRLAETNDTGKPIVLADGADSTNAGACGDSAYVLEKILEMDSQVHAALFISDLFSAEQAFRVGVGNTAEFYLGGALHPEMSKPVRVIATVCSLHDGVYTQEGPAKKGLVNHLGPTAVLQVNNTKIIVTNYLLGPGDLQLFRHHGIEPTSCQLVAVKACTSFRVGYAPIAREIIEADTPGAASANLLRLPYRKMPRSFYPFSEISYQSISKPRIFRR